MLLCKACELKEITIEDAPYWNARYSIVKEIRLQYVCKNCGFKYSESREFKNLDDYLAFLDSYK